MEEQYPYLTEEERHRNELLRQRINDPDIKKQFRNAYVLKASMDYSTLKPFCENIVLATDGYADHVDRVRTKLEFQLQEYDSDQDVLVMAGRSIDNLLVGIIVAQKILQKPKARQSYAIAVYYNNYYKFYQLFLDPTIESYEIYTK